MDLVEIRDIVGSFLGNHDLCSCILVCKLWHRSFLPFIYTKVVPTPLNRHWRSFQPYLCHARDVSITKTTLPPEKEGILMGCQRLLRLNFESEPFPDAVDYLLRLLQRNPQLVRVSLSILEGTRHPELWRILVDGCPKLTELELHSTEFQGESTAGFINLASRLTKLELRDCDLSQLSAWVSLSSASADLWSNYTNSSNDNNRNNRVPERKDWSGFPVLRELLISGYYGDNAWMSQLQIFARAPRLEKLSWNLLHVHYPPFGLISPCEFIPTLLCLLRQGVWPRLNSLEVMEKRNRLHSYLRDDQLAEILTLLPDGLKSFRVKTANFGLLAWQAIQRHLGTLQVLYSTRVPSWIVQAFLTSCPELRELSGPTLRTSDLVRGVREDEARQKNALAVAAMLASKGLPKALMAQIPWKETSLVADSKEGHNSTIEELDEDGWPKEADDMTLPSIPQDQLPRPWVCHRLKILRITLRGEFKKGDLGKRQADVQVFQQLKQLRYLEELFLCPSHGAQRDAGLSPHLALGMDSKQLDFQGHVNSAARIRNYPVGRRLLEIWPGLTSCCWQRS